MSQDQTQRLGTYLQQTGNHHKIPYLIQYTLQNQSKMISASSVTAALRHIPANTINSGLYQQAIGALNPNELLALINTIIRGGITALSRNTALTDLLWEIYIKLEEPFINNWLDSYLSGKSAVDINIKNLQLNLMMYLEDLTNKQKKTPIFLEYICAKLYQANTHPPEISSFILNHFFTRFFKHYGELKRSDLNDCFSTLIQNLSASLQYNGTWTGFINSLAITSSLDLDSAISHLIASKLTTPPTSLPETISDADISQIINPKIVRSTRPTSLGLALNERTPLTTSQHLHQQHPDYKYQRNLLMLLMTGLFLILLTCAFFIPGCSKFLKIDDIVKWVVDKSTLNGISTKIGLFFLSSIPTTIAGATTGLAIDKTTKAICCCPSGDLIV